MKFHLHIAAALVAVGLAAPAAAVTITTELVTDTTPGVNFANPEADVITGTVFENVTGSVSGVRRSPWEGTTFFDDGLYTSVSGGATATYNFDRLQTGLSFVWGSPDDYNDLTLTLLSDSSSTTINGAAVQPPIAVGANLVTITGFTFDRLVFASGQNAFEFANLSTTPIPLPAAGWMLIAALSGLGLLSRKRAAA